MALQSSFKNMVISLTGICLVCAALLGLAYSVTEKPIAAAEKAARDAAINEVLPAYSGELVEKQCGDVTYYVAYSDTVAVGYAIPGSEYGFSSDVALMVGFLPDGTINRTSVLSQAETPGLGANCVEEGFAAQFRGLVTEGPLAVAKDGGKLDAITAATITSRAYVKAVNKAIDIFKEVCHE